MTCPSYLLYMCSLHRLMLPELRPHRYRIGISVLPPMLITHMWLRAPADGKPFWLLHLPPLLYQVHRMVLRHSK